jgi:hypothetical protein
LLIPPEAIYLLVGVNVPDDYLMAGFEVIMNGRFWVSPEDFIKLETGVVIFHTFQKKTAKTPPNEIELARARLKEML